MIRFGDLPALVLGPLAGRADEDWYRAPAGKWCPAQIVHHLAIAVDGSSRAFEERTAREPMRRRPLTRRERVARFVILTLGWFPPGRKTPPQAAPAARPERAEVERQLRDGVARFLDLERRLLPARRADLFLKHLSLGDLTLEEWMRFHVRHAEHHAKQIRARLAS